MVMVGVYVDDILIAGNNRALIDEVKGYIEFHFKIKDMGPVKTMLGINICHNVLDGLLTMDQSEVLKILGVSWYRLIPPYKTLNPADHCTSTHLYGYLLI